jgi:hypothetical protein
MGIKLWDLSTGHCLRTLPLQDRQVDGATLSPDGQRLAILTGWSVFLTDLRSKETVRLYKEGVDSGGACVSWSADGELLVVGQWGGIALWEAASGQLLRKFETGGCEVRCARLSLDERFLVSGGSDHMVRLWDVATGQCLWTFAGHQEGITDVGFNPDCAYIVSRDVAGIQKLWQIDWTLDEVFPAESDEREKRLTRFFARIHTPYALELPVDRFPTELEVTNCLVRRGIPSWTEKELHDLLLTLRCAGCRSRRPEQVLDKIKNTVFS